jgi:hypothetical protein
MTPQYKLLKPKKYLIFASITNLISQLNSFQIMKKLIIYLLVSFPVCLFAQVPYDPTQQIASFASTIVSRTGNMPIFDSGYDNVKGSPFVIEAYCEGSVWMTQNRKFVENYQFKYDETQNVVWAKNLKTGIELELPKDEVLALKLDYKGQFVMYITMYVPNSPKNELCLMQIIYHSPKFCLVKRPSKTLEKVKNEGIVKEDNYSIYKSHPDYYLRVDEQPYERIKLSKKALLAVLSSKKNELQKVLETPEYKGSLTDWKVARALQIVDDAQ